MKKLWNIFVIFFFSELVYSQPPATQWELVFEDEPTMGRQIISTYDSCYLVTATNNSDEDGVTLKIDPLGNIVWSCDHGGYAITQSLDSNYIIAGSKSFYQAFLCKIDNDGNSLWQKAYGDGGQTEFMFIKQCTDSCLIAGGVSGSPGARMYLLQTDLDGNIKWQKHFYTENSGVLRSAVEINSDIYVMGDYENNNYEWKTFLAKIDSQDNLIWDSLYDFRGRCMTASYDNKILFVAQNSLIKINLSGEIIWTSTASLGGSFYSIAPTDNSSYILSGTGIIGTSYISALIAKTDSLGFPLWHKFYSIPGIPYWNNFPSITNTFDKGYIVCGYAEYNSTTKLRVIKTQPDPAIFTGVGALVNENNFTIRPNPSNGRFTVDAGRFDHVAVYNISGEKIYETSGSNPVIDLTGHLAGLYFVQSEGEDHEFIGKVILK